VLDKCVSKPFKKYAREEFELWIMAQGSHKRPTRAEVSQWIKVAWEKVTTSTIINTWKSIVHKTGYGGNGTIIQVNQQEEEEQGRQEEEKEDDDEEEGLSSRRRNTFMHKSSAENESV
jgi:hypothetical protein